VESGQWHEWKTQAKPCPGRQPQTLPPSGAPLFSSARVLIPAVRFCPSLVLLPWRGVERCNRALGPIIPPHEGKIRWDLYQNHEKGSVWGCRPGHGFAWVFHSCHWPDSTFSPLVLHLKSHHCGLLIGVGSATCHCEHMWLARQYPFPRTGQRNISIFMHMQKQ